MSSISQFISNFNAQKGFKAVIRKKLLGSMIQCFEMADNEIDQLNERLSAETARLSAETARLSAETTSLSAETVRLSEGIANEAAICSSRIDGLETAIAALRASCEDSAGRINIILSRLDADEGYLVNDREAAMATRRDLESACENLRNNNAILERLGSDSEFVKMKLTSLEKNIRNIPVNASAASAQESTAASAAAAAPVQQDSEYESIDYFDFENHFRGSIDSIKKAQSAYLPYFSGKKNVIDIGCGRGEFLSLMKDNNIPAQGVDIYEPYADYCNMKGLKAFCGDGTEYLSKLENVDGIFVGQVVEHLKTHEIIRLCNTAYEKLEEGGCIIIETPNPTSLAIYTNAFYIDPSHIKPVHPLTMRYYLEKSGFRNIEIIYTENSRPPYSIPELSGGSEEFNSAMKQVSDILYGSQDYAIVAVK